MELQVSLEARRATKMCPSGFSCLAGDRKNLCVVESCVNGEVIFVRCLHDGNCSYRHPFGNGNFCVCPVRKEIFDRYKI